MDDKDVAPEGMTSESVEEWLEEIADAEGLTREETLEDLVSSYWRLEEIFHLLQDTGVEFEQSERSKEQLRTAKASDLETLRARVEQLSEQVESIQDEPTVSKRELRRAVSNLESQLENLDDELSDLSSGLSELTDSRIADPEELIDRLSTLESRMDRAETKYSSIEERVETVDDRVASVAEDAVSNERFESYTTEADAVHDSMHREYQSLQDLIRSEFGNIRTILTYLLERPSDGENQQRRVSSPYEEKYRKHLNEEETLTALLRRANRDGIRSATCNQCSQPVDLSLLEDPFCPHCEHPFERIERKPRYWGLSHHHVLTSAEESSDE